MTQERSMAGLTNIFKTPWGWMGIAASERGIRALYSPSRLGEPCNDSYRICRIRMDTAKKQRGRNSCKRRKLNS